MAVETILKTIVDELEKMIETKTVVGEPITVAGKTIIPVSKVCFGFGSGGGEDPKEEKQGAIKFGGGGGAGAKIEPIAFLAITDEKVELLPVSGKGKILGTIIEAVPEILDKVKEIKKEKEKEKQEKLAE